MACCCPEPSPRVRIRRAIYRKDHWYGMARQPRPRTRPPNTRLRRPRLSCRAATFEIPIENFLAGPVQHAVEFARVIVDRFQIFDAMRLSAQIGMDRQRHDLSSLLS